MTRLAELTTLRVGGPVTELIDATSEAEFIAAITRADDAATPLLVLGGGSNVFAGDAGFDGLVVRDVRAAVERHVAVKDDGFCGGVSVTVAAGVPWDDVVALAVSEGWVGVEALSGIPGSTGATPVQNVGAYGVEIADTLASIRVWDRGESRIRTLMMIECAFSYRDSLLKKSMRGGAGDGRLWAPTPRHVVLDVTFQLRFGTRSAPIRYPQLAEALGIEVGETGSTAAVRQAVLELRRSKGMVLDAADPDTWSAGSFFTNPIVSEVAAAALPSDAPRYPAGPGAPEGALKLSAAWLIERAGFGKGFAVSADARAGISTKHSLALTNRGDADASEVVALAKAVRDGVSERFGVDLTPEPVLVGIEL